MKKYISILISILFFIWILPLGVFIEPSQEQIACGGQRAICLCRHWDKRVQPNVLTQISLKNFNAGTSKEESSSSGGNHYYLSVTGASHNGLLQLSAFSDQTSLYSFRYYQSIEHVPKV